MLSEWATMNKWYKNQPIDEIKDYFGAKIALYFSWLGFYTDSLVLVSVIGFGCFIYGCITLNSDLLVNDICNNHMKNLTMCPLCEKEGCDYWQINDACPFASLTHIFDNYATIIFTIVMAIWSSLFVNLWKNHSSDLVHTWGLSNFRVEYYIPRIEYLNRLEKIRVELEGKKKKIKYKDCKITERKEIRVPLIKRLPCTILSWSVVLLSVSILIGEVILSFILIILVFEINKSSRHESLP